MSRTCLVVIYNHNYEKNIPVLNRIYADRFSHVIHVMPFYRGSDPNVIGVYENSYQFSGYIAQAYSRLPKDCDRYVFIADDMVLNPTVSERSLNTFLGVDEGDCVTTGLRQVNDTDFLCSSLIRPSIVNMNCSCNACEWRKFLPDIHDARSRFLQHGFSATDGVSRRIYEIFSMGQRVMRKTYFHTKWVPPFGFLSRFGRLFTSADKLYPLAFGYSDFLVIPRFLLADFAHACGVLASARVFAEVAIPTSLVLAAKKIKCLVDMGIKFETGVSDYSVRERIEKNFDLNYGKLLAEFPPNHLFIHPIKLSRWKKLPCFAA